LGCLHRSHGVSDGTAAFHAERRWRVLLREVFRFGTGTSIVLRVVRALEFPGRGWCSGRAVVVHLLAHLMVPMVSLVVLTDQGQCP
jgi:hypothetical protein